jgi:Flp pilus assembly pilin Flp
MIMFAYAFALLERVKADKKGVTALEYGVIGASAVAVLLVTFNVFYTSLSRIFAAIPAAM